MAINHSKKPLKTNGGTKVISFSSKRKFGVEIEVSSSIAQDEIVKAIKEVDLDRKVQKHESWKLDCNNNYWSVKFDRSCGEIKNQGGWEVASFVGSGLKDIILVSKIGKKLFTSGAKLNNQCGFHVHVGAKDLSVDQVSIICAWWYKVENIILNMVPQHRRSNDYCKPLIEIFGNKLKYKTHSGFWKLIKPLDKSNPQRRRSLNICNYVYPTKERKTIEIRLPEGTLNYRDIKNWVKFSLQFIGTCRKLDFPPSLSKKIDICSFLELFGIYKESPCMFLSKEMKDLKMWILSRIITYSADESLTKNATKLIDTYTNRDFFCK